MSTGFEGPSTSHPKLMNSQPDEIPRMQIPKRTGLLKVRIGSQQQIKKKMGKKQMGEAVTVLDMAEYPEAKMVARCLFCGKDYKTEKELVASHPTPKEMKEANETHLWGFWSDDKENPADPASRSLGLLSNLPFNENNA